MLLCVKLIERVQEEYYGLEYMDYHDSDYNWIESSRPGYKELEIVDNSEWFDEYFKKYPRIYKQVQNSKDIVFPNSSRKLIAANIAMVNEKRVQRLLFKLLEQNLKRWWD